MKILIVSRYLYLKGGAPKAAMDTAKLLTDNGHDVVVWGMDHPENPPYPHKETFVSNVDYNAGMSKIQKIKSAWNILYSFEAKKKIKALLAEFRPDIVHLHNFAHQISPSILHPIGKLKIPAVMTLHDYKVVCPATRMYVNDRPCERCKGGKYLNCLKYKCTKDSTAKSLINVIEMYLHHRVLHLYHRIGKYISPSKFLMDKVKEMGLPHEVVHLPNFSFDLLKSVETDVELDNSIVYFSRLADEKGLLTLIDAAKGLDVQLKIIGDGPLEDTLKAKVADENITNVSLLGYMSGLALETEIRKSTAAVLPSEWYENNPLCVVEAFALGKPVIGADIGGIPELVRDGETGYTFEPRNVEDLRSKIAMIIEDPAKAATMGQTAREFVMQNNDPQRHYQKLMQIYHQASGQ